MMNHVLLVGKLANNEIQVIAEKVTFILRKEKSDEYKKLK